VGEEKKSMPKGEPHIHGQLKGKNTNGHEHPTDKKRGAQSPDVIKKWEENQKGGHKKYQGKEKPSTTKKTCDLKYREKTAAQGSG